MHPLGLNENAGWYCCVMCLPCEWPHIHMFHLLRPADLIPSHHNSTKHASSRRDELACLLIAITHPHDPRNNLLHCARRQQHQLSNHHARAVAQAASPSITPFFFIIIINIATKHITHSLERLSKMSSDCKQGV